MRIKKIILVLGIFGLLSVGCSETPTDSDDDSKLSGHWIGSTSNNSLDIRITEEKGEIDGSLEYIRMPGEANFDYELDIDGDFNDPDVEMEFTGSGLSMSYAGTLSSDGKTIDGIFLDDFDITDNIVLSKQ